MNIFVLDEDPAEAARYLCDKHIVKMALESTQILCTVLNERGIQTTYRSTHKKHPCVLWAAESEQNFAWLHAHVVATLQWYSYIYVRVHACEAVVRRQISPHALAYKRNAQTPFVQAMPEQYRAASAVEAYRRYYLGEKLRFALWSKRDHPFWVPTEQYEIMRHNHLVKKLQDGETVQYRPVGNSMTPMIESKSLVTLEPATVETVEKGDAVLARVNGTVYLHKVTAKRDGQVQISNNHGHVNGWTSQVFGKLIKVEP